MTLLKGMVGVGAGTPKPIPFGPCRSRTFWSPNARRRASLSRGTARSGISPLQSNSMTSGSVNPVHRPRTEVDLVRADVTDQVRVVESPLARLEPSLVLIEVLRRQVRPQQRVDLLRNAVLVHRFLLSPVPVRSVYALRTSAVNPPRSRSGARGTP